LKNVKKSLTVGLGLTFAATTLLAGCNSDKPSASPDASKAPAESKAPVESKKPELKPYTVTLMYPGSPQKDEKLVEEAMNKILKEKINASIDIQPIDWGAWGDKTNLIFASGEKADIMFTASWFGYGSNAAKGAYLEVTDLLNKIAPETAKSIDSTLMTAAKINGKLYAVPNQKEYAGYNGMVMRKDLVDKYKFDLSKIQTMADLEPLLKTIKENEPDIVPLYMDPGKALPGWVGPGFPMDSMGDNNIPGGINMEKQDFKVEYMVDYPAYVENLKKTREWYQKGNINKDAPTTKTQFKDLLKAGKVFMSVEGLKPGKDKEMESSMGIPLIQVAFGKATVTTGSATGSLFAISKTSQDPERAMMVINLLHTNKELINTLVYGIEGTHYKKVSDNVVELTNTDGYSNSGASWMLGNQFLNYTTNKEDPQKFQKLKEFNQTAVVSPALGFTFNPEPVKTEIAQINNVRGHFIAALETGSVDPEPVLAQLKDKIEKAGLKKVLDEKQKQLDEWLKANGKK